MGYEIYYDRRFIKVNDHYIPVFLHGSNNCFDYGSNGRMIPEKDWDVFNYQKRDKFLFTETEIKELAAEYGSYEDLFKTRNTKFKPGEFERWYLNGMNNAQQLEYYTDHCNSFAIYDRTNYKYGETPAEQHLVKTNAELIAKLEELLKSTTPDKITMGFTGRELHLPKNPRTPKERKEVDLYFVLSNPKTGYLYKLKKYGYSYTPYNTAGKKFASLKDAEKYLAKHGTGKYGRLEDFQVEQVDRPAII